MGRKRQRRSRSGLYRRASIGRGHYPRPQLFPSVPPVFKTRMRLRAILLIITLMALVLARIFRDPLRGWMEREPALARLSILAVLIGASALVMRATRKRS